MSQNIAVPFSSLEQSQTIHEKEILIAKGDNLERISVVNFASEFQLINKIAVPIYPGDPTPTTVGWYKPLIYSVAPGTNYPNHGNLKAVSGFETLFYFDGITWIDYKNEMPKDRDFVMSTPDAISFELILDVWHLKILGGSIRFGNNSTAFNNGSDQDIILANNNFKFIYGNITTKLVEVFDSAQNDPNLIYFGSAFPFYNIFAMRSAFLVNGKPENITIPKERPEDYIVTKPEWFNIVNTGNIWKIDFINGTVAFPRNGTSSNNNGDQTIVLDSPVYNFLYINTFTRFFEKFDNQQPNSNNRILVAVLAPTFNIFYCRCSYAVNGKPENISFPTSGNTFNPAIDLPLVTNTIAFTDDEPTAFYKDSIFKSLDGGNKSNLILETMLNGKFIRYDIHNPTYLKASQIGTQNRFVIEGAGYKNKIWKDITHVLKGTTNNLPSTLKMMVIQDSLGQGNANTNVAPIAIIKDLFATYGCAVTTCGTFNQDDGRGFRNDIISEGRGYWSYKSFTGKDNYPYNEPISISTGTGLTGKFENPFLRVATVTDKANHPDWCFTNKVENPGDTDGISFADNPNHSNYYIFDFAYYLTQHSVVIPDVIYMALGINDWQESQINITDEFLCFQIMYLQIRAALPNVKLIITPTNGIMPDNQESWENEMFPLAERIIKFLEETQATDLNLHICPIYSHISRQNAGCVDLNVTDLSANNNMMKSTTWDVHVLDKESSRLEYMQVLESVVLAVI